MRRSRRGLRLQGKVQGEAVQHVHVHPLCAVRHAADDPQRLRRPLIIPFLAPHVAHGGAGDQHVPGLVGVNGRAARGNRRIDPRPCGGSVLIVQGGHALKLGARGQQRQPQGDIHHARIAHALDGLGVARQILLLQVAAVPIAAQAEADPAILHGEGGYQPGVVQVIVSQIDVDPVDGQMVDQRVHAPSAAEIQRQGQLRAVKHRVGHGHGHILALMAQPHGLHHLLLGGVGRGIAQQEAHHPALRGGEGGAHPGQRQHSGQRKGDGNISLFHMMNLLQRLGHPGMHHGRHRRKRA